MDAREFEIGIDEAGRGPIAGPLAMGGFVFLDQAAKKLFKGVKESKQLSESEREEWFRRVESAKSAGLVNFCVAWRSEKVIDDPKRGLAYAARSSVAEVLKKLGISPERSLVLLDGGLKAPNEYPNQRTIIRGDEKKMAIALASICAKVLRDRKMRALARKHPVYGFDANKGYGTRKHYEAIATHGMLEVHRRSFL